MKDSVKSRLYFVLLMMSLCLAQGYVVHASQSLYADLVEKRGYTPAFYRDYFQHYP